MSSALFARSAVPVLVDVPEAKLAVQVARWRVGVHHLQVGVLSALTLSPSEQTGDEIGPVPAVSEARVRD